MMIMMLIFFVVVLAVVAGIILLIVNKSSQMKTSGIHVSGTVTGYEERESLNGNEVRHHPVVKFETLERIPKEASLAIGYLDKPFQIGATIKIVYDPANSSLITLAS